MSFFPPADPTKPIEEIEEVIATITKISNPSGNQSAAVAATNSAGGVIYTEKDLVFMDAKMKKKIADAQ